MPPPRFGGPVISFDQMGPISLKPIPGRRLGPAAAARAAQGDLQPQARDPLHLRRPGRSPRPTACPDASPSRRQRRARLHAHDPPGLSRPPADLLHPGQPLGQLDPRHPRLRRQPQDRTRPDPDLRQLPQPDREPLPPEPRARLQQHRLPQLGHRPARPVRTTSPAATAATTTAASPRSNANTESPHEFITGQRLGRTH
jgi:hypothetical protein